MKLKEEQLLQEENGNIYHVSVLEHFPVPVDQ